LPLADITPTAVFVLLGLGSAAVYALLAMGLVMIYRGSGIINFAQGTLAMSGAYLFWELHKVGAPAGICLLAAAAIGALFGFLMQTFIMWPLRNAAPIVRTIATLGVFIVLEAGAALRYKEQTFFLTDYFPGGLWHVSRFYIQIDRLELYAFAVVVAAVLSYVGKRSLIGLATSAAAESERAASTLGWSPPRLATLNWTLGGAFAGLAGGLIVPITGLQVQNIALLVFPALAAALVGRFDSVWLTLLGATLIGVFQSEAVLHITQQGAQDAIPFIVVMLYLVVSGRSLPQRGQAGDKLPSIGSGRIRWPWLVLFGVVITTLMFTEFNVQWTDAFGVGFGVAIILLSVVVVTGYAGQITLAQLVIGGLGAWVAGRLVDAEGWPFWAALLAGVGAAIPLGVIFSLPALRTRGVNLAIVTFGFAVTLQRMLFENLQYGGGGSTSVGYTKIFGVHMDAISHSDRWGVLTFAFLLLMMVIVGNLRRSAAGRRLIAIRANERAAASLGISVVGGKVYAFAVGSAIAALGGILLAFRNPFLDFDSFNAINSINFLAFGVIGGIGYVTGPLFGQMFSSGGVGSLFNNLFHSIDLWLPLIAGFVVIIIIVFHPDGQIPVFEKMGKRVAALFSPLVARIKGRFRPRKLTATSLQAMLDEARHADRERVAPLSLEVRDLSIRYGGVVAVDSMSLEVRSGEIVGLIGPNGAGKTSFIDAISGFTPMSSGNVILGGDDITSLPAHRRVRAGLVRSWQSLELFEEVSVLENLQIACDRRGWWSNLRGLVRPEHLALSPIAAAAVHEFHEFAIENELQRSVKELSFSQRRVVATARALAHGPSVLLLDEPTSGMSDVRRAELSRAVRRLAQNWGIALLIVDHDMPFVLDICDRVVCMDRGRKIADGTPTEVRNDPAVLAAYLRADVEEEAHREPTGADIEAAVRDEVAVEEAQRAGDVLLAAKDLAVGYYDHPVVTGLDFEVRAGEIVALLGANRSGKTTTLLALAGENRPLGGEVDWLGEHVGTRVPLYKRATQGLGFVTDERSVFMRLTVAENLRVGRCDEEMAVALFPELVPLMKRRAGLLSGGEQQMLGLGRALARNPKVLLVDELSLGLAPIIVSRLLTALREAADRHGVGVVLVEQHVHQALAVSDRVCVIAGGRMTLEGAVSQVGHRVDDAFLADILGTTTVSAS
jgi:sulfate-transporting ATPase